MEQKKSTYKSKKSHLLRFYQALASPDTGALRHALVSLGFFPPSGGCRFVPSCSDYAAESISQYGLFSGSVMSLRRILRCHPFSRGGYDPVLK